MNQRDMFYNDMNLDDSLNCIPFEEDFDEDDLEERYVPNLRKEAKRQQAVNENKRNKWKIKD